MINASSSFGFCILCYITYSFIIHLRSWIGSRKSRDSPSLIISRCSSSLHGRHESSSFSYLWRHSSILIKRVHYWCKTGLGTSRSWWLSRYNRQRFLFLLYSVIYDFGITLKTHAFQIFNIELLWVNLNSPITVYRYCKS